MNLNNHRETFLYQKYFLLCTQENVSDVITQVCTQENTFDDIKKVLPWRIKLLELCEILGITRAQLKKFMDTDPSFPKPLKDFNTRRSGVYFDTEQVKIWMKHNYEINEC